MIFNWLKSTKPPNRVGISLGAPRAPETLCSSLASSFLCSPVKQDLLCLRISTRKAVRVTLFPAHCWHREFCSSPSWIYNQLFQLQALPREGLQLHGSSELCWQGGVTGNYKHAYIKAPDVWRAAANALVYLLHSQHEIFFPLKSNTRLASTSGLTLLPSHFLPFLFFQGLTWRNWVHITLLSLFSNDSWYNWFSHHHHHHHHLLLPVLAPSLEKGALSSQKDE